MRTASRVSGPLIGPASAALTAAAVLGLAHGAFSLYWGAGGDALSGTLGDRMTGTFADLRWALLPVGLVKIGFALLPSATWARGRVVRPARAVSWLGSAVLIVWGGVNTVIGNSVLSGMIEVEGGYDRDGMIGHAWLWDPMFLAWGLLLVAALLLTPAPAIRPSDAGPIGLRRRCPRRGTGGSRPHAD